LSPEAQSVAPALEGGRRPVTARGSGRSEVAGERLGPVLSDPIIPFWLNHTVFLERTTGLERPDLLVEEGGFAAAWYRPIRPG
jgi:hypothetical protein